MSTEVLARCSVYTTRLATAYSQVQKNYEPQNILTLSFYKDFSNALKKLQETSLFHGAINASSSDQGLNLAMLDCISQ